MTKKHWTQTKEGRKRAVANLARANKIKYRRWRAAGWTPGNPIPSAAGDSKYVRKAASAPAPIKTKPASVEHQNHVSYAFGHVQAWLDVYANSLGMTGTSLAYEVGNLLSRTARRTAHS